ncbi:MAG: DUF4340 domain-containing protein [Bacteroidales bacterium]|nr:DUF4340 domain-containing protein [Bacteroidales bacterium]MDD4684952.1 DUF4340 domain-containing protein [Bacteroidales bacterium]
MKKLSRNKKNLIIIGTIIVLTLIIAIVVSTQKTSTIAQNFHIEDTRKVVRIVMEDRDGYKSELTKANDSVWMVNNEFVAAPQMVKTLLETLRDMRVREPVAKSAHANIIKQLSARHVRIDIYSQSYYINLGFIKLFKKEKFEKTLYVGSQTMDNMGTYMLVKGTKNPCVVHIPNFRGYLSTRFDADPDDWKTHTIFKYHPSNIASIKVEIPSLEEESFEIYSEGETFHFRMLKDNKNLTSFDTIKVTSLISSFIDLSFERIEKNIPQVERDTIFAKSPSFIFTVKGKDGKTKSLRTYMKMNEDSWVSEHDKDNFYEIFDINRMYGIMDGSKDTLILQYFAFDNLLKPASYYFSQRQ